MNLMFKLQLKLEIMEKNNWDKVLQKLLTWYMKMFHLWSRILEKYNWVKTKRVMAKIQGLVHVNLNEAKGL